MDSLGLHGPRPISVSSKDNLVLGLTTVANICSVPRFGV